MHTKLRCLLLDDEIPGLSYLKMMCGQIPELEIIKAYTDPEKLLMEIREIDFDLVISDIEMPGIDGLTLAKALQEKLVIFTTAYKEYAADAFDIDAVDYITKPVKMERLQKAVAKAVERFGQQSQAVKSITLNTDKGKSILHFNTIALIRTSSNDSRDKEVLLFDGSFLTLKNINFESLLQELPTDFIRINKKEIIAMKAVKFFSHNEITLNVSNKNSRFLSVILSETYRSDFISKAKI